MKENLLSLIVPGPTGGQGQVITPPPGFITIPGDGGLSGIIQWIIIILVAIGIIAALIFLIWGAIKWIASGGDKEKIESARKTIIFSIIGLIIVLLSVVIMQFIGGLLGVKSFDLPASESGTENSRGLDPYERPPYDCEDGSNGYDCHRDAPNDTFGPCPICSPNPNCGVEEYTIARCSVDPDKPDGCYVDSNCTGNCPRGKRDTSYCLKQDVNNEMMRGTCQTNCIDIDNAPGSNF